MMNKFRLPLASFKSSQSNLCLIPSWPQFSEYLTTNIPRRKRQLNYFPLINTLPWQFTFSSTDFTFFIHLQSVMMGENWREGIFPLEAFNLESSIISRTKGLGGKGRQSKGNLAAGAETGQHQPTHIDWFKVLSEISTHTHWFKVLPLSELNTNPNIHSNLIVCTILYIPPHQN